MGGGIVAAGRLTVRVRNFVPMKGGFRSPVILFWRRALRGLDPKFVPGSLPFSKVFFMVLKPNPCCLSWRENF